MQPPLADGGRTEPFGWIDDACTLAISATYADNQGLLEKALAKADVWSKRHSSKFAPDQFELIHFKNPQNPDPTQERDSDEQYADIAPQQEDDPEDWNNPQSWDVPTEVVGHDRLPLKDHATGCII